MKNSFSPTSRLVFLLATTLVLTTGPCLGQTLNDILARHDLATGSSSRQQVATLISIGTIAQMDNVVPISIIQKRPDKYRFDVHLEEGRVTQAYDGKNGWSYNPFTMTDTLPLTGSELAQIRESADFDGILHTYRSKGYTIKLVGKVLTGPSQTFKIQVRKPTGEVLSFYLDAITYLVIRSEAELLIDGMRYRAESTFGDFRKIAGMTLPYYIRSRNGNLITETRIDTVRINEKMEDFYFQSSTIR